MKADLQLARQTELDLQEKLKGCQLKENEIRQQYMRLHQDNETLQTKMHNLVTARQQDRQTICCLERKLQEEKKSKCALEQQLVQERKQRSSTFSSVGRDGEYSLLHHQSPIGSGFLNGIHSANQSSQHSPISASSSISEPECNDSFTDNRLQSINGFMQIKSQCDLKNEQLQPVNKDSQVCSI